MDNLADFFIQELVRTSPVVIVVWLFLRRERGDDNLSRRTLHALTDFVEANATLTTKLDNVVTAINRSTNSVERSIDSLMRYWIDKGLDKSAFEITQRLQVREEARRYGFTDGLGRYEFEPPPPPPDPDRMRRAEKHIEEISKDLTGTPGGHRGNESD